MTIALENVNRIVAGETHIADMTVAFAPGSVNVLLGPTMAGKTTLLRLLAGLDRPTTGRIVENGVDVTGRSVRKRNLAMVYQQFINYPSFTVFDNIASPLRRAGMRRDEIDEKVRQAARSLHIDELLNRLPDELSGGQQQRTALARALVKDADLLLLDEPLVNLDYKLREELREELREIFQTRRSIVVYATTEPVEALLIGGTTVVLDQGRALQVGSTTAVYHHPDTLRVGEIFSDPPMNEIEGTVTDGTADLGGGLRAPMRGHLRHLASGRYRFGVRANHLFAHRQGPEDIEFTAPVELAEISGSETFIHVALGAASWVVQEEGVFTARLGQEIKLYLDPRNLFAFALDGRLVAAPAHRSAPSNLAPAAAQ
ncbi:MAG: ABC transporter ATP-binding protein [Kiloniellaceae bacterium]